MTPVPILGCAKFGWLNALRKSARNCNLFDSVNGKFFCNPISTLEYPGPMMGPWAGQFPKVPAGGVVVTKSGLNHNKPAGVVVFGYVSKASLQFGRGPAEPVP